MSLTLTSSPVIASVNEMLPSERGNQVIEPEHLPPEVSRASAGTPADDTPTQSTLASQEERIVRDALEANDWNQSAAARELGITRDILRSRIKRYQLRKPE